MLKRLLFLAVGSSMGFAISTLIVTVPQRAEALPSNEVQETYYDANHNAIGFWSLTCEGERFCSGEAVDVSGDDIESNLWGCKSTAELSVLRQRMLHYECISCNDSEQAGGACYTKDPVTGTHTCSC